MKVFGFLSRFHRKKSPLNTELENLERNIRKTDEFMRERELRFWREGGICCPGCGVRGWHHLELKQERRRDRVEQIRKKLGK